MAIEAKTSSGTVLVSFRYVGTPGEPGRETHASVLLLGADGVPTVLGTDHATCGKRDNFSKEIGRQIALGRTLKHITRTYGDTDELVQAIKSAYRARRSPHASAQTE